MYTTSALSSWGIHGREKLHTETSALPAYRPYHDPETELSSGLGRMKDHAIQAMFFPKGVVWIFRRSLDTAFTGSVTSRLVLRNR